MFQRPDLYDSLCEWARMKFIWLGRYGYGFTKKVKADQRKNGYPTCLKELEDTINDPKGYQVLRNLWLEGSIFASYSSLIDQIITDRVEQKIEIQDHKPS